MTKTSKKQRKKLREQEERKKQLEKEKLFSDNRLLLNNTIEPNCNVDYVDINNPLVLEFFRALKNQKVYGKFCKWHKIKTITQLERVEALRSKEFIDIGHLTVIPDGSDFIRRVKVLKRMIGYNNYNRDYKWHGITIPHALGAYAKEYFSTHNVAISHSPMYYQFIFGTASLVIGMLIIFAIIFYFWGKGILSVVLLLFLVYSGIGIYKLCKF